MYRVAFHGSASRKRSAGRIQISLLILLLGLALNILNVVLRYGGADPAVSFSSEMYRSDEQLTCAETIRITQWAAQKSILNKHRNSSEQEFARRVVSQFFLKMDPNRLLVTKA